MANWIWLSHVLSAETPVYGNGSGFSSTPDKQIEKGDSCNTLNMVLPNHIGSHVDVPKHFTVDGMTVDAYAAGQWVFKKPLVVDLHTTGSEVIGIEAVSSALSSAASDSDLILLRTGIEAFRGKDRFWKEPPGFAPELYNWLRKEFPVCGAIGMDTISISSFAHRDVGREAHCAFLEHGVRIFEDLALSAIEVPEELKQVIALPLRIAGGDGAPATLIGEMA